MRQMILSQLVEDETLAGILSKLTEAGLEVSVHPYCAPYTDHSLTGFVDGPPSSSVVAVISGEAPGGKAWRRFTLRRLGEGRYELGVFPTAFHNRRAPLAPGIPPGASRREP
jgi:hypothetical protein